MTEPATITAPLCLTWEGERAPFAKAFIAAQRATEAVKKAASNPAFKSKYADLSEVVEATLPALNGAGIGVIQSPAFDGEMVSLTTVFVHESGASLTGVLRMRPTKPDPQGVGSAITYARRYALLAMTGAAPEDDDGNAASRKPAERFEQAAPERSEVVVKAAVAAIAACADRKALDAWRLENEAMLETMHTDDANDVVRAWKAKAHTLRVMTDTAPQKNGADKAEEVFA